MLSSFPCLKVSLPVLIAMSVGQGLYAPCVLAETALIRDPSWFVLS